MDESRWKSEESDKGRFHTQPVTGSWTYRRSEVADHLREQCPLETPQLVALAAPL